MGYSPWGHKESDMTKLPTHTVSKGTEIFFYVFFWRAFRSVNSSFRSVVHFEVIFVSGKNALS